MEGRAVKLPQAGDCVLSVRPAGFPAIETSLFMEEVNGHAEEYRIRPGYRCHGRRSGGMQQERGAGSGCSVFLDHSGG